MLKTSLRFLPVALLLGALPSDTWIRPLEAG